MTPTSVGMRCPECARQKTQVRRMPTGPSFIGADRWSATNVLIAINVVAFVAELLTGVTLGGRESGSVFFHGALYGPSISGKFTFGPGFPAGLTGHHQYWRLLTSGFLHEGLLHIGLNMLSLWFVGRALEPAIGKWNFVAIYFAALLAGSFGALAFEPQQTTVGASGAIFGVFGALIALSHRRGISIWQTGLAPILLINLLFDLTQSGISIGGHIGGLIAGVICGFAFTDLAERRRKPAWAYVVFLLVACVSVAGAILVSGYAGLTPTGFTI